ncbi:MAG: hypothetical protein JO304_15870, partial [Solirubrobacterales bacterium]|nr:hypothetical protein [Solirubrobacterales bacterium]
MIGSPRAGAPAARRWREPRPQIPARPAPRRRIHWPPFVRDAASYSGGSLASQLSTVVYNVALRRILAPAVMGLFDFVTVVLNFTLSFDPGISAAATIKLPALKGAGDEEGATVLRSTAFWAELAQALLMAAGIGVFILVGGATGELATAAAVAAATVVLYCMQDSLTTMHQGHQSWVAMSGALVAASLLGVALLPGGALIAGIRGLFIGSIALWTLRVALLWLTARRVGIVIESRFDWAGFRSLMGLGFPLRLVDF